MEYLINPLVISFLDINNNQRFMLTDVLGNFLKLKPKSELNDTFTLDEEMPVYIDIETNWYEIISIVMMEDTYYKIRFEDENKWIQEIEFNKSPQIKLVLPPNSLLNLYHNEIPFEKARFRLLIEEQIHLVQNGKLTGFDPVKSNLLKMLNMETSDDPRSLMNLKLAAESLISIINEKKFRRS